MLDPGTVTPEGHSCASPGAGSAKTGTGVELERRELQHAAPGAGKGRAELGFLEERRKLCPFLEVAEESHREKLMDIASRSWCQVKDPLGSCTQILETPMPRPQDIDSPLAKALGTWAELCCATLCLVWTTK